MNVGEIKDLHCKLKFSQISRALGDCNLKEFLIISSSVNP